MAIKSDGGSSSYYDLQLPDNIIEFIQVHGYLKTEDLIKHVFGNDFDYGNMFKSMVRAYKAENGEGKEGNDVTYDMNKVQYYANKVKVNQEK